MSYSANDNQNYFVAEGRTTSRVQAQPGGHCSISLGGWTPEELERQRQLKEQREKMTATGVTAAAAVSPNPTKVAPSAAPTSAGKENNESTTPVVTSATTAPTATTTAAPASTATIPPVPTGTATTAISSNAFASASNTNSFNVITDRPTSRVSRPPGGHTSIRLW